VIEEMIHPDYFPFTEEQLMSHFAEVKSNGGCIKNVGHLDYYKKSVKRYREYVKNNPDRRHRSLQELKFPCQIEKDERFWIARSLMTIFHSPNRTNELIQIFTKFYGDSPPVDLNSWLDCLKGDLCLFFEPRLPSPNSYKEWLRQNLKMRQFIPYILDSAYGKKNLEGPTNVDAMLLNPKNGFSVLIEAKVLSDVSTQVSYDVLRNQIARNIDVMLEKNDGLCSPLNLRRPERTLFLLVTPKIFKENPSSRLYGYKMNEYLGNPNSIQVDLPHRNCDWNKVSKKLGWITWEDLSTSKS
jgi:hypothetical protein